MNRDRLVGILTMTIDNPQLHKKAVAEVLAEYDRMTAVIDEQAMKLDQRGAQIIAMDIKIRELVEACKAARRHLTEDGVQDFDPTIIQLRAAIAAEEAEHE